MDILTVYKMNKKNPVLEQSDAKTGHKKAELLMSEMISCLSEQGGVYFDKSIEALHVENDENQVFTIPLSLFHQLL